VAVGVVCAGGWPASWGTCCAGGVAPTVTPPVGIVAPTPVTIIYVFTSRITELGKFPSWIIPLDVEALWKSITSLIIQQFDALDVSFVRRSLRMTEQLKKSRGTTVNPRWRIDEEKCDERVCTLPICLLLVSSVERRWNCDCSRLVSELDWLDERRTSSIVPSERGRSLVECLVAALLVEGTFSGERTSGEIQRVTL